MTIRVSIENKDTRSTAIIGIEVRHDRQDPAAPHIIQNVRSGESVDVYVSYGTKVLINEIEQ